MQKPFWFLKLNNGHKNRFKDHACYDFRRRLLAKLRDAILDGVFTPGEKLLEADLCRQMGVSRTSVREALRQLEAERLVTIIPGIAVPRSRSLPGLKPSRIYDARQLLEGEAAARFAERATAAEIARAKGALADFDRAMTMDDAHGRLTHTQRFYDLIIEGCGNPIIGEMLQSLFAAHKFFTCALDVAKRPR